MSQDILGEFGKGNSVSQTAARTDYRGVRRLRERFLLRRERLHRVLNVLNFLPKHYASQIDFKNDLESSRRKLNRNWLTIMMGFFSGTLLKKCLLILKIINLNF
jgi:hypothetical protein